MFGCSDSAKQVLADSSALQNISSLLIGFFKVASSFHSIRQTGDCKLYC
jgi:hypothetical protein